MSLTSLQWLSLSGTSETSPLFCKIFLSAIWFWSELCHEIHSCWHRKKHSRGNCRSYFNPSNFSSEHVLLLIWDVWIFIPLEMKNLYFKKLCKCLRYVLFVYCLIGSILKSKKNSHQVYPMFFRCLNFYSVYFQDFCDFHQ